MRGFEGWVGRERTVEDLLAPFPTRGMAALLDRHPHAHGAGDVLPHGWHWLYFHAPARRSELGPDGHERLGAFLPPIPLPRRMWAGGRLAFPGELRLGERAVRRSAIESVQEKEGRSGRLVFITVRHTVETERGTAVEEEQDLVYREAGRDGETPDGPPPPAEPAWSEERTADTVSLFRFSALTFNGHRIHYDHPWATEEEGYPGLVVHGPLLALLLLDAAERRSGAGRPAHRFAYRALSPLFADEPFRLEGATADGTADTEPFRLEGATADGTADTESLRLEGATAHRPVDAGPRSAEVWAAGPRGTAMRASAGWDATG